MISWLMIITFDFCTTLVFICDSRGVSPANTQELLKLLFLMSKESIKSINQIRTLNACGFRLSAPIVNIGLVLELKSNKNQWKCTFNAITSFT